MAATKVSSAKKPLSSSDPFAKIDELRTSRMIGHHQWWGTTRLLSDYLFSKDDADEFGVARRTFTSALDAAGDHGCLLWRLIVEGRRLA
jgi:hypothetical protein